MRTMFTFGEIEAWLAALPLDTKKELWRAKLSATYPANGFVPVTHREVRAARTGHKQPSAHQRALRQLGEIESTTEKCMDGFHDYEDDGEYRQCQRCGFREKRLVVS
jgi:hypothetical protein